MIDRLDIPFGRSQAITKADLARLWHCDEREARAQVARLRLETSTDAILSTSHQPPGYWRSSDPDEIAAFIRETESRARNTFMSLKGARYVLKQRAVKRG